MKCPNCGMEVPAGDCCGECGWAGPATGPAGTEWPERPAGYVVGERFVITDRSDTAPDAGVRWYRGRDMGDGQTVLIKEATAEGAGQLQREYEILTALSHPAVPRALALVPGDGSLFLVLQDTSGAPLARAWRREGVTEAERLDWLAQLCDALAEIHAHDVVYLAVHPERLLVTEGGRLILADFSLARRLPIDPRDRLVACDPYSAPEVFLSPGEVDGQADVYGLGATWYSLLLGKPLGAEHFEEMFFPRPPLDFLPDLLPAVNRIVVKAMQRSRGRRYRSVLQLRDALEEVKLELGRDRPAGWGACSDTGIARHANEDSYLVEEFRAGAEESVPCRLCVVADGMGGEAGGATASRMTVRELAEAVEPAVRAIPLGSGAGEDGVPGPDPATVQALLGEALNRASAAVYERARQDPSLSRMGATAVVALIVGRQLFVANVGDSRAYLINGEGICRLSRDHTVIAELIERGELDEREARTHPARGQLTRNIGARPRVEAHFCHRRLEPGDMVLLCSDGLPEVVDESEIQRTVLEAEDFHLACQRLVNLANGRGGPDNVTVVITGGVGGAP